MSDCPANHGASLEEAHEEAVQPSGPPPKRKRKPLWNDETFRRRVQLLSAQKGVTVREAMTGAGVATDYINKSAEGRSTNLIMAIADYFEVTPEYLAWDPEVSAPSGGADAAVAADREDRRIEAVLRIFSEQTLAVVAALALLRPDLDPKVIIDAIREGRRIE
jgi:hypothetical protein